MSLIQATGRPLVSPSLPERDANPSLSRGVHGTNGSEGIVRRPLETPDHIKNNHTLFPPSPTSNPNPLLFPTASNPLSSVDDFLLSKALKPSAVCTPIRLVSPLATRLEWAVETIYILRPLLYGALWFLAFE